MKMKLLIQLNRNNLWFYLFIVISGLFANSCQSNKDVDNESSLKEVSEYYQNNQLKVKGYTKDSLKMGIFYYYDKEGRLEEEVSFKNDKNDGDSKKYYSDGSIVTKKYLRGYKIGKQIYLLSNGKFGSKKAFIKTYYDSTQLNTWKSYNSTGYIVNDSSCYFEVLNPITSINQGEYYDLEVQVPASYYNQYVGIYQCDYMKEFDQAINPENHRVKPCKDGVCTVPGQSALSALLYRSQSYLASPNA